MTLAELRSLKSLDESLERSIVTFGEKGTLEIINSEAFDSVLRARKRLQKVFDGVRGRAVEAHPQQGALLRGSDFVGEEWQHRKRAWPRRSPPVPSAFRRNGLWSLSARSIAICFAIFSKAKAG